MAKKKKQSVVLKDFRVYDSKMSRNLTMFVPEESSKDFETTKSFYRQVEMAWKIVDFDTGKVLKNKVEELVVESEKVFEDIGEDSPTAA